MTDEGMWAALASMEAVFEQRQNVTVLYDLRAILLCAAVPPAPPAGARQSSCKRRSRQFAPLAPLAPLTAPARRPSVKQIRAAVSWLGQPSATAPTHGSLLDEYLQARLPRFSPPAAPGRRAVAPPCTLPLSGLAAARCPTPLART
jgi:hypothetical protein